MIRPLTIATFLMACGSGLYLYQSKHEVQLLDRTIERTVHETAALREQSRLLAAEWTMLNDPERLRQFSDTYLDLQADRADAVHQPEPIWTTGCRAPQAEASGARRGRAGCRSRHRPRRPIAAAGPIAARHPVRRPRRRFCRFPRSRRRPMAPAVAVRRRVRPTGVRDAPGGRPAG